MTIRKTVAVLFGERHQTHAILASLDAPDIQSHGCLSSDHLYQLCTTSRIDAIVIENDLPGFLQGLDIISRLAQDLVKPLVIVIGDLSNTEQSQAAALNVAGIVPADASPETIAATVQRALLSAIHDVPQILHPARLLVRDASFIRPLPQLISRIASFLDDPHASVKTLAKELSTDARVTAELLKTVQAVSYGVANRVSRIQDAVSLLGVKRTVALVLSTYVLKAGTHTQHALPLDLEQRIRMRSVLTAAAASSYASILGLQSQDTAFILGLMQDMGMLVMAHELGEKYQHLLHRCWTVPQLQIASYEKGEFGYTHADVSAALLQKWELPAVLTQLVLKHHQVLKDFEGSAAEQGWLEAMQAAEAVADLKDQITPQRRLYLQRLLDQRNHGDAKFLRNFLTQSTGHASELMRMFEIPVPDEYDLTQLVARLSSEADLAPPPEAVSDGRVTGASVPATAGSSEPEFSAADAAPEHSSRHLEHSGGLKHPQRSDLTAGEGWPEDQPLTPSERIVILDDEPRILQFIEHCLANTEFIAETYTDPEQALHRAAAASVVLVDLHLDHISGADFLRVLRRSHSDVPVLMMSGDRTRGSVVESIQAGISDYLTKPFSKATLLAKLRRQVAAFASSRNV